VPGRWYVEDVSAQDHLERAHENLIAVDWALGAGAPNVCASRAYYAAFHAAIAALIHFRDPRPQRWDHGWVQASFAHLLRSRSGIPGRFKSTLTTLLSSRRLADYEATGVSRKRAERVCRQARDFVTAIERGLNPGTS